MRLFQPFNALDQPGTALEGEETGCGQDGEEERLAHHSLAARVWEIAVPSPEQSAEGSSRDIPTLLVKVPCP